MFREMWHRPQDATRQGRDATIAQVIESIDRTAPQTKARLAADVGISEQYLSELLQELKADDIVRKAYVVDDASLYAHADSLSALAGRNLVLDNETLVWRCRAGAWLGSTIR